MSMFPKISLSRLPIKKRLLNLLASKLSLGIGTLSTFANLLGFKSQKSKIIKNLSKIA